MQTHSNVLSYRIDIYFHDCRLAIQINEDEHNARNVEQEIQRQKAIEKELCCQFVRINPNDKCFNIFEYINKITKHIEKSTKNSLKDKISNRLL